MAQVCNHNYLGGGDPKDCSTRPALAKSSQDPISADKNWWLLSQLHGKPK
jgi:hypothetical protein